jgi:flagellar FliL protein
MSTAATPDKPDVPDEAPPPKSRKKLFVIAGAVLALAAGSGGAFLALRKPHDPAAAGAHAEAAHAKKAPTYIPFDAIIVNLREESGERMIQVAFSFETTDPKAADAVRSHLPAIRNRLILLISSRTAQEIAGREGKERLAADMLAEARIAMGATKEAPMVDAIHFSSLIIQ